MVDPHKMMNKIFELEKEAASDFQLSEGETKSFNAGKVAAYGEIRKLLMEMKTEASESLD